MKLKTRVTAIVSGLMIVMVIYAMGTVASNDRVCTHYTDISSFGVNQFIAMDVELMANFPMRDDWENIEDRIKTVAPDSLRYIDSLDITYLADTVFVKMYSQNYAYRSSNTYQLTKNNHPSTDTLMIFKMDVDFRMKEFVDEAGSFRISNYSVEYRLKQNLPDIDKRIIFHKNFLPDTQQDH